MRVPSLKLSPKSNKDLEGEAATQSVLTPQNKRSRT